MQKRVKMSFEQFPKPNVLALIKELEEKGLIVGDSIVYKEEDEPLVSALFDKYFVPILNAN